MHLDTSPEYAALARAVCLSPRSEPPRLALAGWLERNADLLAPHLRAGEHHPWVGRAAEVRAGPEVVQRGRVGPVLDSLGETPLGGTRFGAVCVAEGGFVVAAYAPLAWYDRYGAELCRRHPLRRALVGDRDPDARGGGHLWHEGLTWRQHRCCLPRGVFRQLWPPRRAWDASPDRRMPVTGSAAYGSDAAARLDLSRAVLAWCRRRAGLPGLGIWGAAA
jgi:hypothetical protein